MQLRPPAIPLITVDPYFSVWSTTDKLTSSATRHWTCAPNNIYGTAEIDGKKYRFMGRFGVKKYEDPNELPAMEQTDFDCSTFSTKYTFKCEGIILSLIFTTPLLINDYYHLTRPVSYLKTEIQSSDGMCHSVKIKISVSEELCLDHRNDEDVTIDTVVQSGYTAIKMGNISQPVLAKSGDNIRINWGYIYLGVNKGVVSSEKITVPFQACDRIQEPNPSFKDEMTFITAETELNTCGVNSALFTFAYDDIESINYFGDHLKSYWNKDGKTITEAIAEAYADYDECMEKCSEFEDKLFIDATRAGGEKYAEICELSYRQALAAQKLVIDKEGNILFISKECFSNGCAVTVDVSYPAIPLYLIYNPELVRGMLLPIVKFAKSDEWKFDFAPHDAGQYPLVIGQHYGNELEKQMPVEESGNMIIMAAAALIADGDTSFIDNHLDLLESWVKYLENHGEDPENQLCTDDFAGHLAHNCNLSIKAIMGIVGLGIIYKIIGRDDDYKVMFEKAKKMAESWKKRASNGDGSYRLAFDKPGTWSMKYNMVWDKIFDTEIMDSEIIATEFASYKNHINTYGMPLDSRETYTKSDWLVWTGTLASTRSDFEKFVNPMWDGYNSSLSRVPMTDLYYTTTSIHRYFQHRSVVGGHYMKLLEYTGKMKNWKK